jgi:hypothetical protein
MQTHVKVLAVLLMILGALGVLGALGIMALFGGAAGLVGATAPSDEALIAVPAIGLTGTFLTIFLLVVSVPGLVAGFGLWSFKSWARILGIVLCALNLIAFPWGTLLGIYGLWVLLSKDSERLFNSEAVVSA